MRVLQNKEVISDRNYSKQTLVLGTHTSENEQNYLMLAEVQLPLEDSEMDARQYDDETNEVGGGAENRVNMTPYHVKVARQDHHESS